MNTWRELISEEMASNGDDWSGVEAVVFDFEEVRQARKWRILDPEEPFEPIPDVSDLDACLDYRFSSGYGTSEGPSFTLWTKNRVYFPVVYDGAEWAGSVPRNPCSVATGHLGGQ